MMEKDMKMPEGEREKMKRERIKGERKRWGKRGEGGCREAGKQRDMKRNKREKA